MIDQPLWYARRLRQMSAGEVAARSVDHARRLSWRRHQVRLGERPAVLPRPAGTAASFAVGVPGSARTRIPPDAARRTVAAAEAILSGRWEVLGIERRDIANPDWFFDPVTGRRAPDAEFAFAIAYRDEHRTGNVKAVWELSRHHHLTVLAAAYWLTGDDRYAEIVAAQLRSWWRLNPFLSGINWTSGIELGVRLISWVWIRRLLDGWPGATELFEQNDEALRQIWWHQRYLAAFPSRGSSANNHLVAEAAGQVVAACGFPWFAQSVSWRSQAIGRLEAAFAANTFGDGVNRELATDYHRFVTELVTLATVEAAAAGTPLGPTTRARLTASFDAAAALADVAGRPPRQGDGDDGRALVLDGPAEPGPWALLIALGSATVGPRPWWPAAAPGVLSAVVGELATRYETGGRRAAPRGDARPAVRPDHFPDAGITLLRTPAGASPELWCRLDGGPHGFLSIAAHAHADALSVEFRHDGVEVLADPGTYCYHGEAQWRDYFRSTGAHNCVVVDDTSQSVPGGPFLWRTRADAVDVRITQAAPQGVVGWRARQDGYRRLDPELTHTREVTLDPSRRSLRIVDRLASARPHRVRVMFHLGPAVDVRLDGAGARLCWPGKDDLVRADLQLPAQLRWSRHRGEHDPVLGWYSPRFGVRVPSVTLVGSGELGCHLELASELQLAPSPAADLPRRRPEAVLSPVLLPHTPLSHTGRTP